MLYIIIISALGAVIVILAIVCIVCMCKNKSQNYSLKEINGMGNDNIYGTSLVSQKDNEGDDNNLI